MALDLENSEKFCMMSTVFQETKRKFLTNSNFSRIYSYIMQAPEKLCLYIYP